MRRRIFHDLSRPSAASISRAIVIVCSSHQIAVRRYHISSANHSFQPAELAWLSLPLSSPPSYWYLPCYCLSHGSIRLTEGDDGATPTYLHHFTPSISHQRPSNQSSRVKKKKSSRDRLKGLCITIAPCHSIRKLTAYLLLSLHQHPRPLATCLPWLAQTRLRSPPTFSSISIDVCWRHLTLEPPPVAMSWGA